MICPDPLTSTASTRLVTVCLLIDWQSITTDILVCVMISHPRPSEGPSTQPLSSETPSTQPLSSAPVVRRSVLETPRQYLRRRMSYTKHNALKLGADLYLDLPSDTDSHSGSHSGFDSEESYGRRSNKRTLRASSDTWVVEQNQNQSEEQTETEIVTEVRGERKAGEGQEGVEGDRDTPVWQRYQDLTSVDVQLEDTGTNFASVGLNYTITFIIQSYGEYKCDDYGVHMLRLYV